MLKNYLQSRLEIKDLPLLQLEDKNHYWEFFIRLATKYLPDQPGESFCFNFNPSIIVIERELDRSLAICDTFKI